MLSIGNEELLKSLTREVALSHLYFQEGRSAVWRLAGKIGYKETTDGLSECNR